MKPPVDTTSKLDVAPTSDPEANEYHAEYGKYADTLRTWLVGYGVGGPLLLLSRVEVGNKVAASGHATLIVVCFLSGVGFQVGLAFINKWINWRIYAGLSDSEWRGQRMYTVACKVSEYAWIDVLADVGTLVAFGTATVMTLLVLTATPAAIP